MPTLAPPYGVTPQLVASRVPEFRLDETSRPSLSDAQAIVDEEAAYVAGRLRRMIGRTTVEGDTDTHYIVRGCVFDLCVARLAMLRGRGTDQLHTQVQGRVDERLRQLAEEGATGLGDGAASDGNARVRTSTSDAAEARAYIERSGSIGLRLATRGRL